MCSEWTEQQENKKYICTACILLQAMTNNCQKHETIYCFARNLINIMIEDTCMCGLLLCINDCLSFM